MTEGSPFPNEKYNDRKRHKAFCKKTVHENQRTEHHQMIPVENTAGGAATVFHNKVPEGAPEQHANQIAYIEERGNPKHCKIAEDALRVKPTQAECQTSS